MDPAAGADADAGPSAPPVTEITTHQPDSVESVLPVLAPATTLALAPQPPSRYESQKRRDWNTFLQYLKNQKPPLSLPRCSGANVIDFLKYLDQFGKTKVHVSDCQFYGQPTPPASCGCPLMQAWGSLDALIGRLRAAYEESGGKQETNPFAHRAVRVYLREVREGQAKARGIPYEKKKRKRGTLPPPVTATAGEGSGGGDGEVSSSKSTSTSIASTSVTTTAATDAVSAAAEVQEESASPSPAS